MSQIVDDLRQVAIEIKTETQVGGNTAARVGGAFERVADALEGTQQIEDMDAAVAAVQQAAQENEQTIQDIVNNLAVVQTTGQSTSDVMSQKAVSDAVTIIEEIDLSSYTTGAFYLWQNKWHAGNISTGTYIKQIGVLSGEVYRIVPQSGKRVRLFYMTEFYPDDNSAASYIQQIIPTDTTTDVTIPDGYHFMIMQDEVNLGNTLAIPSALYKVTKVNDVVDEHSAFIDDADDILFPYTTISEYGNGVCVDGKILKVNGTIYNFPSYKTSNFITIPNDATGIIYDEVYNNNADTYCGIVIADSNQKVIWFDARKETSLKLSGSISLADYPSAAYIRFCVYNGNASVKFVKREEVDVSIINGNDVVREYGCSLTSQTYHGYENTRWCSYDNPCTERGILQSIYGNFYGNGNIRLYICTIDQNDYLIVRDSFLVAVTNGVCNVDVSARNIEIMQGEYIFFDPVDGSVVPNYGNDATFTPKSISMSINTGTIIVRQDGIVWDIGWSIKTHTPSYLELVQDAVTMQDEINTNAVNIANLQNNRKYYIEDSATGMTYLLGVRNGAINLVPMQFSKALVLGNSITKHGIAEGVWYGVWGMAATKPEYDFVHVIEEGLRVKDANAECVGVNIAAWERDFSTNLATLIGNALTSSTDLVVIRLGENVPSGNVSSFQSALGNLVDYIYSISQNAKVVITTMYWANTSKDAAIAGAANAKHIDLIPINQFGITAYEESVGHYVYGDDNAIHEITNSGVANHPSNVGMAAIANAILTAIGYERVEKTYSLQEVTIGGVTGTMWVEVE